jgi:hypothetical protein
MSSRPLKITLASAAALALSIVGVVPATAHDGGDVATNTRGLLVETEGAGQAMRHIANIQYDDSGEVQNGSDIEFMRVGKRKYALAGTLRGGMHIIDITKPRKPKRVAIYDCAITQGDIQVWTTKTQILASYTADSTFGAAGAESRCARDLKLEAGDAGTVIVDLTNPKDPKSVAFLPVGLGSHNMTIHPSGDYLYNSNSDLITSTEPSIAIFDISNPRRPKFIQDFPIPFVPASLGSESHDITFSADGTRAYSAALSQTLVLDTTNPEAPEILSQIIDPSINVVHQSDPVTLTREDGSKRTLLVITDERAGAAASVECPGGGLHIYDITGELEEAPAKIGAWFIDSVAAQEGTVCTSHVLRMYEEQAMMTIAWYSQGVRVLDISGLADYEGTPADTAMGDGVGMKEIGSFVFPDSDTWSFKTNKIRRNGSFFGYGNDLVRGFDVYRFDGSTIGDVTPLKPKNLARPIQREFTPGRAGTAASAAGLALGAPLLLGLHLLRRRRTAAAVVSGEID